MSDFPSWALRATDPEVLSTADPDCCPFGDLLAAIGVMDSHTQANATNQAVYMPVVIFKEFVVSKLAVYPSLGPAGNVDIGVYDEGGARLVSTGSTAVVATGQLLVDVADTTLAPGRYFLAVVQDASAYLRGNASLGSQAYPAFTKHGIKQQDSAFPLPATATFADFTGQRLQVVTAHRS